ncbi:MAG: 50S ribosomal protein L4 [Clostridia bacterium]|nr:50S ribosomal protein L4 [Clostridia bacterium]MBO5298711.1 50S ribosomal protein L4 [Clostridia bacterium]MBQ4627997.1 50S ribosomal protein L4 [Clostridia bacterium]
MANVKVYDMTGKETGTLELNDKIFGVEVNVSLLHEAVKNYLANQRQGTQSTKTRTEVRGGGRKPFRQKGTGRARQGSIRAPQWYHGGVALGPKPRSYKYSMNKKAKRGAMKSAFSSKVQEGKFIVLDALNFDAIKTKNMVAVLKALNATEKSLVVLPAPNVNVVKSAKNIPGVKTLYVNTLNVYDIINHDNFIVTKEAVQKIEEVYV